MLRCFSVLAFGAMLFAGCIGASRQERDEIREAVRATVREVVEPIAEAAARAAVDAALDRAGIPRRSAPLVEEGEQP